MSTIKNILNKDEKIIWRGKPKFWPFIFGGNIVALILGIIFMIPTLLTCIVNLFQGFNTAVGSNDLIFVLSGLGFVLFHLSYRLLEFNTTQYFLTDKRVLVQSGVIGTDFNVIEYDLIADVRLTKGIADSLFGQNSGTIRIFSMRQHESCGITSLTNMNNNSFRNIEDVEKVAGIFSRVSLDIKSDIRFPNYYRNKANTIKEEAKRETLLWSGTPLYLNYQFGVAMLLITGLLFVRVLFSREPDTFLPIMVLSTVAMVMFSAIVITWSGRNYILTKKKILIKHDFISSSVIEIELGNITDITLTQNLVDTLFYDGKSGSLSISTRNDESHMIYNIANVHSVQKLISENMVHMKKEINGKGIRPYKSVARKRRHR